MLFPAGRMVLPWALLLLFLTCQIQMTPVLEREEKIEKEERIVKSQDFPPTLEFAVYTFNRLNKDKYAYKVVNILSAKEEKVDFPLVYSMKVSLGRTKCKKFEENIDNCPLQEFPGLIDNINCFFIVSTYPWKTKFELLKEVCSYLPL